MTTTHCTACDQACDTYVHRWRECEEFWGAPAWREESEDRSECCDAEVNEVEPEEAAA